MNVTIYLVCGSNLVISDVSNEFKTALISRFHARLTWWKFWAVRYVHIKNQQSNLEIDLSKISFIEFKTVN